MNRKDELQPLYFDQFLEILDALKLGIHCEDAESKHKALLQIAEVFEIPLDDLIDQNT